MGQQLKPVRKRRRRKNYLARVRKQIRAEIAAKGRK